MEGVIITVIIQWPIGVWVWKRGAACMIKSMDSCVFHVCLFVCFFLIPSSVGNCNNIMKFHSSLLRERHTKVCLWSSNMMRTGCLIPVQSWINTTSSHVTHSLRFQVRQDLCQCGKPRWRHKLWFRAAKLSQARDTNDARDWCRRVITLYSISIWKGLIELINLQRIMT